ncbi:MAG: UV DNA damage repair endonuclease UvsE [Spirochaetes bacterium]|nr:UV DNA damage repair endonuclease UvsE [Spirochaetota bacterium]
MIRLGLCCIFRDEPIAFRRTTAASLAGLSKRVRLARLSELCLHNARSLADALAYCARRGIGDFRINSQLLPLYTHPSFGYRLADLPESPQIEELLAGCATFARRHGLRTTFHPDQFVLLSSPSKEITDRSFEELAYQAELADLVGADVLNIHGGGAYGEPAAALARLRRRIERLPDRIRRRLTLENDDRVFTPADLLPVSRDTGVPLVYDVHHHRVLPDGLSIEEATRAALATWRREPLFHVSSPREGWKGPGTNRHHDFVRLPDIPDCWLSLSRTVTVEVEAKAKEVAVLRLKRALERRGVKIR